MAAVGRNDPCPCGSGKKYKHCHGTSAPFATPSAWHDLDRRLSESLLEFSSKRRPHPGRPGEAFPYEPTDDDLEILVPWLVYELPFEGERRIVDLYLDERGERLSARERAWLEANTRSWLSAWQVTAADPGHGVTLVDRLTGAERNVHDVAVSRDARPGLFLLARVVDIEDVCVLCGTHPRGLDERWGATFIDDARRALRVRKKHIDVARLRRPGAAETLLGLWQETVDDMTDAPPPTVRNADGDALLWTEDHFVIDPAERGRLVTVLSALDGAHAAAARDDVRITMTRRTDDDGGNVVLGSITVGASKLVIASNSVARADELRARVERAASGVDLASAVRHRMRAHEDVVAEATSRVGARGVQAPRPMSAEEAGHLRAFKERHYRAWLEQPLPALAGKTPREATKTSAGRAAVERLLREIEMLEAAAPEEARFDVGSLREELGLERSR